MAERVSWLVLVYRVPSEPSRLRAAVWRRLKALGAVYLANSVAALPASPESERALRSLRNEIGEMGGSAQLLSAHALVGEADVVATFNAARDEEYTEIVSRCEDFLAEKFTYAELEENDEDLVKLRGWLEKVQGRDVLGAGLGEDAARALVRCQQALDGFAERVYAEADATT
jgi:DNA-binding transcriptional regulator PaaX